MAGNPILCPSGVLCFPRARDYYKNLFKILLAKKAEVWDKKAILHKLYTAVKTPWRRQRLLQGDFLSGIGAKQGLG